MSLSLDRSIIFPWHSGLCSVKYQLSESTYVIIILFGGHGKVEVVKVVL